MAQDISSPQFQRIANEYLNIGFGTEQIFNINDFVKAYDKNGTASPLAINFKFREDKILEIKEAVRKHTAVLINGASGVGKTRISLEICKYFETEGYHILCVKNNGQPLYDDFKISVSTSGKYLLFIDDINQSSDIASVMEWILLNNREDVEIKILATVRDYAKEKIAGLLRNLKSFKTVKISIFKDENIKTILDECLEIKNPYFQDRIAKIAKGNVRLAVLAGKFAIEDVDKIKNSAEIFKHYYGEIIDEEKLSSETIKILFIISLLNTVKSNDDFAKILLDEFNITWGKFIEISRELHKIELVDFYLDEIVKIGDQSFGNYILEYVLVEQKFISVERLLELGFNVKKNRIIYAINTVLELFYSKEVKKYFFNQINNRWNKINVEDKDAYLEAFYLVNLDKALDILYRRISDMKPTTFIITDNFFEEKQSNQNITNLELNILSGFKETKYFKEAIQLIIILLKKRPDLFMDIYCVFTKNFSYDKNSFNLNYKNENILIDTLWELRTENNINYDFLLLKIIKKLLKTCISTTEQREDSHSVVLMSFNIGINDGCMRLRRKIWGILSELYKNEIFEKRIQLILSESYWNGEFKHNISVFEFDLSCITDLFANKWLNPNFDQCLVLSKINNLAEIMNVKVNSDFRKYETNKNYQYYKIIKPDGHLGHSESLEGKRNNEIKNSTKAFEIGDYQRLFSIAKRLEADTDNLKYQIGLNLVTVIKNCAENLYEDMIKDYFECGAPFTSNCIVVLSDLLDKYRFNKTYKIISQANYQLKNNWIKTLFEIIPEDMVKEEQISILLEFYRSQKLERFPCVIRLNTILKYAQFDDNLLVNVCGMVHEISCKQKRVVYDFLIDYQGQGRKIFNIFSNDFNILENLYMDAQKENFDYDGELLLEIIKMNPLFWNKYTMNIASENLMQKHDKKTIFQRVWLLENYHTFIDTAFFNIIQNTKSYVGQGSYELMFPVDKEIINLNENIKKWIKNYIYDNHFDSKLINSIFFNFVSNQTENDKLEYIEVFLKQNKIFKDFEKLSMLPTSLQWSGSEVPLVDRDISFIETLSSSSFLNGLDFTSHRNFLKNLENNLEKKKRNIQIKEYQDDFIN